ncbi:MAG: carbohydrate kinase family protein [Kiritimatiellae bacterium]|nr:carbohydrate kinase family protein [Kiritimatiellia bacterium]
MRRIVAAGSILVDHINGIDAYPNAGELAQIRSVARAPGGLVPNTGRDIRSLAPDVPVAAFGMVGDDDDGRFAVSALAASGIDTSGIAVSRESKTSFTEVMSVAGGERTFFTFPGASAAWGYGDFPFDLVSPGDIVLLGYFLLLEKIDGGDGLRILRELKSRGALTAIDLVTENSRRYALVRECLPHVDFLIVNETEAVRLADTQDPSDLRSVADSLVKLGVRESVVIHHPGGAVSLRKNGAWSERRSFALPDGFIKGKTGAGDAFCAGTLTGIYKGLSDKEILELGSLAAVGALSAPGATEGMRSVSDLRHLISTLNFKL